MLSFLKISNLAILDDVSIEPGPGLNVLTGETGAGKSIIVDAIGLLLGDRGDTGLIRSGCDRLVVEGQFDLSRRDDLDDIFAGAGVPDAERAELVIRRELSASDRGEKGDKGARSRAFLNGRLVTLAALKTLGESLADLHGQHQHQSLLRTDGQRDALDRFAGTMSAREDIHAIHARLNALAAEQRELEGRERERARLEDALKSQIAEIDAVDPKQDEEERLTREESLLRHAEEILRLAGRSFALVSEDDESVLSRLGLVEESAQRLGDIDPRARDILAAIREARVAAAEAARGLSAYLDRDGFDPSRLEQVAARLTELDRLRRKYGASLAEVVSFREDAARQLEALGGAAARLAAITSEWEAARAAYMKLAGELSERRRRAAARLEKSVEKELRALAMEGTRVEVAVEQAEGAEPGPSGLDTIEFLIAPNKGEELRPLARTASGGELSRLMLAVRNATQDDGAEKRTLVFDEVDSGIGGRVGEALGQRLAALGEKHQVLCVTHLPQIASFAQRHFRVAKRVAGQRTQAVVTLLDQEGRIDELARMLGGSPAETARRHAAALLGRPGRGPGGVPGRKERSTT